MIAFLFGSLFLVTPFIFLPLTSEIFEFNKIICLYVFTVLIVGAWVIKCIISNKFIFRRTVLDLPLLIFLFSQIISTIFSIDQISSLFGYYGRFNGSLLSSISYILLYWAFVSNINQKQVLQLIKVILLSAFIVCVWAILERYGHSLSCLLLTGQFDTSCWAQDVSDRVFGSLGQPNWLGAWLVTTMPIAWITILNSKHKKYLLHALSLALYLSLLFTKSRSAVLGFIASYASFWGLIFTKSKSKFLSTFLVMSIYIFIATVIFGTPWTQGLYSSQSTSIRQNDTGKIRLIVWKGAMDVWINAPLIGTGVETFAHSYYKYRPLSHNQTSEWDFVYNKAHNEFLNYAANTGLFGLFSYLLIIVGFTYWSIKKNRSQHIFAFLAAFIGLNITSIFGFLTVNTSLMFFLIPAMAISLTNQSTQVKNKKLTAKNKIFLLLTLVVIAYLLFQITKLWMADVYFTKGREYNKIFKFEDAAVSLQKAILLSPQFAIYHDEIAQSYLGLEEIDSSINHINIAKNLSLRSVTLAKSRASLYVQIYQINQKYFNDAVNTLLKLTEDAPTDPQVLYMLGLVYASHGDANNAIKFLEEALLLKPDYQKAVEALTLLGYNSQYDTENR